MCSTTGDHWHDPCDAARGNGGHGVPLKGGGNMGLGSSPLHLHGSPAKLVAGEGERVHLSQDYNVWHVMMQEG